MSIFQVDPDTEAVNGFSFSGSERNRLFLRRGKEFEDASLVSGIDFKEDGRGFVIFDFDKDGAMDLGIVSNQNPRFRIVKNNLAPKTNRFVTLQLVGGNDKSAPNSELSPRSPIGATIVVTTDRETRLFQLSCGEGFSTQNSQSFHIGMGEHSRIDKLEIRWPSGIVTVEEGIAAGSTVKVVENRN